MRTVFLLSLVWLLIASIPSVAQEAAESPGDQPAAEPAATQPAIPTFITLPAGTPLNLMMLEELYSQRNMEGDEIVFALTEDVVFLGKTYLVAGTPVVGRVTSCQAASSSQGGSVDIEIRTMIPPYGMPITLSGSSSASGGNPGQDILTNTLTQGVATQMQDSEGEPRTNASMLIGVSVLGLLSGSFGGSGAVIPAGTTVAVFTSSEGTLLDIPREEMQSMVDDWYRNKVISSFLNYSPAGITSISAAMSQLGYTISQADISIRKLDQYNYEVAVPLSDTETAIFSFQPFQEPHAWKFSTMVANNDPAQAIFSLVR
jgi:hypothetical protein